MGVDALPGTVMLHQDNTAITPLRSTAYERVRDAIRAEIFSGRLAGGMRLTMREMMHRYQISSAPIREALSQLHGEGLIEFQPNRGAQVRRIDEKLLHNIYDVREALHGFLAAHYARTCTAADVDQLHRVQEAIAVSWQKGDLPAMQSACQLFHEIINAERGNREALEVLERNAVLTSHLRRSIGFTPERVEQLLAEHEGILRAFEKRSPDAARDAAAAHIRSAAENMIARFRIVAAERAE